MGYSQRRNRVGRKMSRKGGGPSKSVGDRPHNKVSFAAKLAAFILEDHRGRVEWSEEDGFAEGQPHVFGVLPFLHLNISEKVFRKMLASGQAHNIKYLAADCESKDLNKKLEAVSFNCNEQSSVGVNALHDSTTEGITNKNRWEARKNGRRVLSQVEKYMRKQNDLKIIKSSSIAWCK